MHDEGTYYKAVDAKEPDALLATVTSLSKVVEKLFEEVEEQRQKIETLNDDLRYFRDDFDQHIHESGCSCTGLPRHFLD